MWRNCTAENTEMKMHFERAGAKADSGRPGRSRGTVPGRKSMPGGPIVHVAAPGDGRCPAQMPRLTPYAEQLLARSTAPEPPPSEWITTTVAAKLTNYSIRWITALCDNGFFVEGQEWKQRPACPGFRKGGQIRIKRSALKKLEGECNR